jgi:hypothetical protein
MTSTEVLALVTGRVNEELLLRNEYLAEENRILREHAGQIRLTDAQRMRLARMGKKLGRRALAGIGCIVTPETILRWYRELIAKKFDGSRQRGKVGRPRIDAEIETLVVRMATDNAGWGCDRIVGALSNLGYEVSDRTVGHVLDRHGLPRAPERAKNTTWREFIGTHKEVLAATDFFTVEVVEHAGLETNHVLMMERIAERRVRISGATVYPDGEWMKQMARNETMEGVGFLEGYRYLLRDRDCKYTEAFDSMLKDAGVNVVKLPPQSPNLNAHAERWVGGIRRECLSKLIVFGYAMLRRVLSEYLAHFHAERNHQGVGNVLLFPDPEAGVKEGKILCRERLGGLLRYYYRKAA